MSIKLKQLYNSNGRRYTISSTEPTIKSVGDYWDEELNNNSEILEWRYNGSKWLSRNIYRESNNLYAGQSIGALGLAIGTISGSSEDVPFCLGSRNIYLIKILAGFRISSGNLSTSNYWRLNFKSAGTVIQSINITSGDNSETTGRVRKTSGDINTVYLNNAYYDVSITKIGNAPDIVSPVFNLEYRLVR